MHINISEWDRSGSQEAIWRESGGEHNARSLENHLRVEKMRNVPAACQC